ncbi:unnamed protein product, partial [Porites evermanni]
MREKYRKQHAKKFRCVMKELKETLMLVERLPYLDSSLSIFRFYMFVERNILIDVDMLRDLDLPLSVKQYGFCPASTTTDCLLDLLEETTTTLGKGDTDKKLIAFVASVMLIALLKQIKSGVPAGLLSS